MAFASAPTDDSVPQFIPSPQDTNGQNVSTGLSLTVNGITCALTTAVFVTAGPNGQPAQFSSRGNSGPSYPIYIDFDTPLSQVSIQVVGLSFPGHITNAYDANHNLLISVVTNPTIPDFGTMVGSTAGIETIQVVTPSSVPIASITLIPSNNDYVSYNNLQPMAVPIVATIPPPSLPPAVVPIDVPDPIILVPPPVVPLPVIVVPAPIVPAPDDTPSTDTTPVFVNAVVLPITIAVGDTLSPSYNALVAVDPKNTHRATDIGGMYELIASSDNQAVSYDVGKPLVFQPIQYLFRNDTINTTLKIEFTVPNFLQLNVPLTVLVAPLAVSTIQVSGKESAMQQLSQTRIRQYESIVNWAITPINITGPVLVQNGLPTLKFSSIS